MHVCTICVQIVSYQIESRRAGFKYSPEVFTRKTKRNVSCMKRKSVSCGEIKCLPREGKVSYTGRDAEKERERKCLTRRGLRRE